MSSSLLCQAAEPEDGARFLVGCLWPRGIKKEALRLDGWLKDVAPSDRLRLWFADKKWGKFQRRYCAELDSRPEAWRPILQTASRGNVTLLCSARDTEHNNAVAFRVYLEKQLKR